MTQLKVSPIEVSDLSNENAVISFIIPEVFDKDVIQNFCHFVYGFKDQGAFKQWKKKDHENSFSFTLWEAFKLGKLKNEYQYGEIIKEKI